MSIEIRVINDSIHKRLPSNSAKEVIQRVFAGENVESASVTVVYLDSDKMAKLNLDFLQHEGPTDVITFPLEEEQIDGEIYICPDVAKEQAVEYKCTFKDELLRLTAHGALHLCGYDDDTEEKRNKMHILETKYIYV